MLNNHRVAFQSKSPNDALEYNLDQIVNLTSVKLKELISKRHEKARESSLLKAQRGILESDIAYYEKETKEKEEQINKLNEDFGNTEKEIEELEKEYKTCLSQYNIQNENLKVTEKSVIQDLTSITISNGIEETSKISDTKIELECYQKIKSENKRLKEQINDLRRELYFVEIEYKKAADFEIHKIYRTRKGIETINKLDQLGNKFDPDDDFEDIKEEEKEENEQEVKEADELQQQKQDDQEK